MFRDVGHALYRRAVEEGQDPTKTITLPAWTWIIFVANAFVLLPIFIIVNYSLKNVYPVLAIIEDESPPVYEPLSPENDDAPVQGIILSVPAGTKPPDAIVVSDHIVTSSVRRIHRLLRFNGGFRAYVRGLACFMSISFLTLIPLAIFGGAFGDIGAIIGGVLASLALVQFSTAWVHIVISKPSSLHFWSRLPEFRRTFRATWRAILLSAAANHAAAFAPYVVAKLLHFKMPIIKPGQPTEYPDNEGAGWKSLVIFAVSIAMAIFVTIPAHVILIRVQASLLPEEDETIVCFDRSFKGKVEPAIVDGKGYVSIRDAWSTFSAAAWRRLLRLYVKISLVLFAFTFIVIVLVILPQVFLVMTHSKVSEGK